VDGFVATRQDGVGVIGKDDGYFVFASITSEASEAWQSRVEY